MQRSKREGWLALGAYLAVCTVVFWPLLTHLHLVLLGSGGDAYIFQWNQWWVYEGMWRPGQSLYWTDYQYYPEGLPLHFRMFSLVQLALAWPFYRLGGPIVAQNLVVFSSFVLSGWATFLLARFLGTSRSAAFLAGLILTFSPFHFAQALGGHTALLPLHWPVFSLLAFLLWKEKGGYRRAGVLGLSLTAVFYTEWYLMLYTLILLSLALLLEERSRIRQARFRKELAVAGLLFLLLAGPTLIPALLHAGEYDLPAGHIVFSADLTGFFVPGDSSIWRESSRRLWERFTGGIAENGTYLGYTVLCLALLGILRGQGPKKLWLGTAAIAFTLSLGPYLHVAGIYEWPLSALGPLEAGGRWLAGAARHWNPNWSISEGHVALPLPYLLFKSLPLFSISRVPSRFVFLLFLALALLAAGGLDWIRSRLGSRLRRAAAGIFLCLVGIEYWPALSMRPPPQSEILHQLARLDDSLILEDRSSDRLQLYHQTVHGKRITGGASPRRYWKHGTRQKAAPDYVLAPSTPLDEREGQVLASDGYLTLFLPQDP